MLSGPGPGSPPAREGHQSHSSSVTVAAWAAVVAVICVALIALDVAHHGPLSDVDRYVSERMLSWGLRFHPWPRRSLTVGLWFGQRGTVLVGSALLAGVVAWRSRAVEPVVRLIVAVVTLGIVVYGFKLGLARNAPIGDAMGEPSGTGASFPSGHTANAVLLWGLAQSTAVRWNLPDRLTTCIRVGRWLAPWVVSAAMILLDYHWVSDLIAGAAVGVALLWLTLLPAWEQVSHLIDRRLTTRSSPR